MCLYYFIKYAYMKDCCPTPNAHTLIYIHVWGCKLKEMEILCEESRNKK